MTKVVVFPLIPIETKNFIASSEQKIKFILELCGDCNERKK
jgi:hypothetical protein